MWSTTIVARASAITWPFLTRMQPTEGFSAARLQPPLLSRMADSIKRVQF
ncbi:hypothetical protein [Bartonella phoceensis]|nr:hypothetical protein [Bartonella phoceensis]